MNLWVPVSLFAGILSFLSCTIATMLAERSGMIAQPGVRQSHEQATPTGGGLGLIFSILVTTSCLQLLTPLPDFWWHNMVPGIVILAIVGWYDDKHHISSIIRLLVQLAVSLWLLGYGWSEFSLNGIGLMAMSIVAIVWIMNLYNFMDGSNGMAGFQGLFAGMTMAVLFHMGEQHSMSLVALAVAAVCAGFLPLNFPQARVFMGDVASVPLGFIFASLAVYGVLSDSISLAVSILIMSVFIVDSTLTLLSRVIRGERWYTAHAQHVYQRLIAHGWKHRRVLLFYQAINVIVVLPAIVLAEIYPQFAMVIVGTTLFLLASCWQVAKRRLGTIARVQIK